MSQPPSSTATLRPDHVRWMIRRDMPEVLELELLADAASRWDEEKFLRHLRQRNCIGMIAERGETIVGALVYVLKKHCIEVLKMGGIDEHAFHSLRQKVERKLSSPPRSKITWTVAETRRPVLDALKESGWRATGLVRGEFLDGDLDGIAMEFVLPSLREYPA